MQTPNSHQFIIISGLPASGKTQLGAALADRLNIPLLDKDTFLETLFDDPIEHDDANRFNLSRKADKLFQQSALLNHTAILVSWWKHPQSTKSSGTSADWLLPYTETCFEIHCKCSSLIATNRFISRVRHPDHEDSTSQFFKSTFIL